LSRRESWWKDAEILMLRYQLSVALRERPRGSFAADVTGPAGQVRTLRIERLSAMLLIVTIFMRDLD
jgi:hypothetical protein